jgi:hypothetical protein
VLATTRTPTEVPTLNSHFVSFRFLELLSLLGLIRTLNLSAPAQGSINSMLAPAASQTGIVDRMVVIEPRIASNQELQNETQGKALFLLLRIFADTNISAC